MFAPFIKDEVLLTTDIWITLSWEGEWDLDEKGDVRVLSQDEL